LRVGKTLMCGSVLKSAPTPKVVRQLSAGMCLAVGLTTESTKILRLLMHAGLGDE
jgi:hypothetical protein